MRKYDYLCDDCTEMWVEEHELTYEGPIQCPTCKSCNTHKIILEVPGINVYWKDASTMSESRRPKYYPPVKSKYQDSPEDYGGV